MQLLTNKQFAVIEYDYHANLGTDNANILVVADTVQEAKQLALAMVNADNVARDGQEAEIYTWDAYMEAAGDSSCAICIVQVVCE